MESVYILTTVDTQTGFNPVSADAYRSLAEAQAAMREAFEKAKRLPAYEGEIANIDDDYAYIGFYLYWDIFVSAIK